MQSMSPTLQRFCAWLGPLNIIGVSIGFAVIAGFFPPPSPEASGATIAHFFVQNATWIQLGMLVMIVVQPLIIPWAALIAVRTRRQEEGFPLFTYAQVGCLGCAIFVLIIIPMVWAVAAFRPGDIAPDITRMLNDTAWFLFLYTWPPFSAWNVFIAVPILRAKPGTEAFPRWVAYLNIWVALLLFPAGVIGFFKTGPFAFNGVIAFYIPLAVFFGWIIAMTVMLLRGINEDVQRATGDSGKEMQAAP